MVKEDASIIPVQSHSVQTKIICHCKSLNLQLDEILVCHIQMKTFEKWGLLAE